MANPVDRPKPGNTLCCLSDRVDRGPALSRAGNAGLKASAGCSTIATSHLTLWLVDLIEHSAVGEVILLYLGPPAEGIDRHHVDLRKLALVLLRGVFLLRTEVAL